MKTTIFAKIKHSSLFFILIFSTLNLYAQEIISQKVILQKGKEINFRNSIEIFPIKDKGFILITDGFANRFHLIDYNFNLTKAFKEEEISATMANQYDEGFQKNYCSGDSSNIAYLKFSGISYNFSFSIIDKNFIVKKGTFETNLKKETKTQVKPMVFSKWNNNYFLIVNYFDKANNSVYKLYVINTKDLSVTEKILKLPLTPYEVNNSYFMGNTTSGDDDRCLWKPKGIYKNKLVFIKAYYLDENKDDKKTIVKTIEMDINGTLSSEFSYTFTNTSEEKIRKRTTETEFDFETGEFYLSGHTGNIKASSIPGFYVAKYQYKVKEIYTKVYNYSALEKAFNAKLVTDNMPHTYIFLDKFNHNVVIASEYKGMPYSKGSKLDYYSFNSSGEIVKIIRRSYEDIMVEDVYINKKDPILKTIAKNLEDFMYSFASKDHWKDEFYEFTDVSLDETVNSKFLYCFMINRSKGEIAGYKLKR